MNVGELLKEKERLEQTIEEAKVAKGKIRQLNVLIALYSGDDESVSLDPSMTCNVPDCQNKTYCRGLCSTHYGKFSRKMEPGLAQYMDPPKTTGRNK